MSSQICGNTCQPFGFDETEPNRRLHAASDLTAARSAAREILSNCRSNLNLIIFPAGRFLAAGLGRLATDNRKFDRDKSSTDSAGPLSRTPDPSPSRKTTPSPSSVRRSVSPVAAVEWPLLASKLMTARRLRPDLIASFACVIARRTRAARHWLGRSFIEARMPIDRKICNAGEKSRCG